MTSLPLASVTLVLRHQRGVGSLPHVAGVISAFLGLPPSLTLARACSFGSLALLDRMWQESCVSSRDKTPWWALSNFLRSDRHYYRWQFSQGLEQAARHGHLHVVEWLFAHFTGCKASIMVVEAAAEAGHLAILQYLLAHASAVSDWGGQGTQLYEDGAEENPNNGIQVCWGREDMAKAARNGHADIARWLHEHTAQAFGSRSRRCVMAAALSSGDLALVDWLLARGYDDVPLNVAMTGNPRIIERLLEQGCLEDDNIAAAAVGSLAVGGHLEMMKRVEALNPARRWRSCHLLREAVVEACRHGRMAVVRWLLEQHDIREKLSAKISLGMHTAAVNGHLELAQYLYYTHGLSGCSHATMRYTAAKGHLRVVQWLHSHCGNGSWSPGRFRNGQDYDTWGDGLFRNGHESPLNTIGEDTVPTSVIDAAASRGHLDVVEFLHSLSVVTNPQAHNNAERASDDGDDGRRPWATHMAMDEAAKYGHLHVVQWLFTHRTEGCTADAMDNAAQNGHLDVVKWLHTNTKVGCTDNAMDYAACNGHLEVVQWLHSNRSEGCTTYAMDDAALSGHLHVVQWLYANRSEGCTENAVENAIGNGHIAVVQWLLAHYPQYVNAAKAVWNDIEWVSFEMLLFVHSQYPEALRQEADPGVRDRVTEHIRGWVEEHYPNCYV